MLYRDRYPLLLAHAHLEQFDPSAHDLSGFECEDEDYTDYLKNDAAHHQDDGVSGVHLLVDQDTAQIVGYVVVLCDSFTLNSEERKKCGLGDLPFNSVPALKVGKLAVDHRFHRQGYGSLLLELCHGMASSLLESGIACRFLTVDADTDSSPTTPEFYKANGFVRNENYAKSKHKSISMRYDMLASE